MIKLIDVEIFSAGEIGLKLKNANQNAKSAAGGPCKGFKYANEKM